MRKAIIVFTFKLCNIFYNQSMITLFLLRHGETVYNIQEIVQGWNDSPLTPLGLYQAKCTGYGLRDKVFIKAISGDSGRQVNTANEFMKENKHPTEIIADKRFREMCFGKYEYGTYIEMLEPVYRKFNSLYKGHDGLYEYLDDIGIDLELYQRDETGKFEDIEKTWMRISEALKEICDKYKNGNILISTSSFAINTILINLFPDFKLNGLVSNASVTVISFDGTFQLLDYNNIEYRKEGEEHFSKSDEKQMINI